MSGSGGLYIHQIGKWRYYRVRVAGRMNSPNIHRTCKSKGFVTPCPGRGGKSFHPPPAKVKVKGCKAAFANGLAFIGLNAPVSSLCQFRYGTGGRIDARCGDGWELESKTAGAPVCEDDNVNEELPCSMLMKSCRMDGVQAKCAATCNVFDKGGEECKAVAIAKNAYKCVRKFSCTANPKAFSPIGIKYLKPRPSANQQGCGAQNRLEVGACSSNPKEVSCGCPSAYLLQGRSLSRSDCDASQYQDEGSAVLKRISKLGDHTTQWLQTCASVPESSKVFQSKPLQPKGIKMRKGKAIVWETSVLHGLTVPKEADGCFASFSMSVSVCNSAPFKRMILRVPFTGEVYKTIGCGCQEVLARAGYNGQITLMENKMKPMQKLCAKHFEKWNSDFMSNYFFGGMQYQGHAIRLAKEIRKQCKNPGEVVRPEVKYKRHNTNVEHVMQVNAKSIKTQEATVQQATVRGDLLKQETAQCIAKLPMKKQDNYKDLVGQFSLETDKSKANLLNDEAIEMKAKLKKEEMNAAKLKKAQDGGK